MAVSLHDIALPTYRRFLGNLSALIAKGEAHVRAQGGDPEGLVEARLAEDMKTLAGQVQLASDTAKGAAARLSGQTPPSFADDETTLAQLQDRIARTLAYLETVTPEMIDGDDGRTIELPVPDRVLTFTARDFVIGFAVPNFLFHVNAAYMILRNQGVPLGKLDYFGGI